jgi:hypothetical protein
MVYERMLNSSAVSFPAFWNSFYSRTGMTSLMYACENGHITIAELLILIVNGEQRLGIDML